VEGSPPCFLKDLYSNVRVFFLEESELSRFPGETCIQNSSAKGEQRALHPGASEVSLNLY
ncbi:hypothetical protein ACW6QP_15235, partial [Salegentibacter sp. HM20]